MVMENSSALLFDMDGVILDSMPWHVRAWRKALAEFGCEVDEELIYLHEGAIEPATAADIFNRNGCCMDEEQFLAVLSRQIEIFNREFRHRVTVYRDVPDMLASLGHTGKKLAIVTSSHSDILEEVLPKNVRSLFSAIITGDSVDRRKPWPDPYLAAMKNLGQRPETCCVIENAPAGIESARAARMKCIAITTTLSPEHLKKADLVVENHGHLHKVLCQANIDTSDFDSPTDTKELTEESIY